MTSITTLPKKEYIFFLNTLTFSGGTVDDTYFLKLRSKSIFKKHSGQEISWINLSALFLFKIH